MQFELFPSNNPKDTTSLPLKECWSCKETLPLSAFPHRYAAHKDNAPDDPRGRDHRCKSCMNKNARIVANIKKTAPPKPVDMKCQCCGSYSEQLDLDHDHATLKFRGWLCRRCNIGMGKLGDNIESLQQAIDYLKKHSNG